VGSSDPKLSVFELISPHPKYFLFLMLSNTKGECKGISKLIADRMKNVVNNWVGKIAVRRSAKKP
jgi:hypothetical protein